MKIDIVMRSTPWLEANSGDIVSLFCDATKHVRKVYPSSTIGTVWYNLDCLVSKIGFLPHDGQVANGVRYVHFTPSNDRVDYVDVISHAPDRFESYSALNDASASHARAVLGAECPSLRHLWWNVEFARKTFGRVPGDKEIIGNVMFLNT